MRSRSDVQYATSSDGASIAFQVVGSGPPEVLYLAGIPTQLQALWELPVFFYAQYLERLASFSRLVLVDARGSGLSDPLPSGAFPLDAQVADVLAVLDAAGLESASVIAEVNAGPVAIRLAAQHPQRVRSLVLNMTFARMLGDGEYPGPTFAESEAVLDAIVHGWGSGISLSLWTPDLRPDERLIAEMANFERLAASPARVRTLLGHWRENDARADLAHISVPTLVMHDEDNPLVPTAQGRYLAEHIPGATFAGYPSPSEMPFAEQILVMSAIQCEFLTGTRAPARHDRVIGVLLFVDVVGSTDRAFALGDVAWRADVEAFRRIATGELLRTGGRLVNTRGDDLFVIASTPTAAIELACELRQQARNLGLDVRVGLHLAEVEDAGEDVLGLGVHVAARVCSAARPGEIWVTDAVRTAVLGGADGFEPRGEHELKGIPGSWPLSAVGARGA
jgi:class 3 adenylate cyclase/pimeloyl-ACP methyl ester carboxylesterase